MGLLGTAIEKIEKTISDKYSNLGMDEIIEISSMSSAYMFNFVIWDNSDILEFLEKINSFLESATSKRDLGLYLQGQILEAKSEVQNIKAAIEAYSTLTKNYPASKRWDDANKRMIYLKRFYLEVR